VQHHGGAVVANSGPGTHSMTGSALPKLGGVGVLLC
jgi:hypothetical protein